MSTLYARANPRQARVLRIVEGAAKNAFDAHPQAELGPRLARSIAKRAAGTLTSQWGSVLATPRVVAKSSDRPEGHPASLSATSSGHLRPASAARCHSPTTGRGAVSLLSGRPLVRRLHGHLGALAGDAKRGGDWRRYDTLVEVLRLIAKDYLP